MNPVTAATTAALILLALSTGCTMNRRDAEDARLDRQLDALRAGEMRIDPLDPQQLREDANDESLLLQYSLD